MTGRKAHHFNIKKSLIAPVGVMAVLASSLAVTLPAQANSGAQQPSEGKFSMWKPSGDILWKSDMTPPPDPDGQTGRDNPLNLQKVGPMQTREANEDAPEGTWTNVGTVIRTEDNDPPALDTDTVRYLPRGATQGDSATKGQHYSLTRGSWKYEFAPSFVPGSLNTGDPEGKISWQRNTEKEPHGDNSATWVNEFVHKTGKPGHTNWFAYTAPDTDVDYLWQKQEWVPGDGETVTEYGWPMLVRTYTGGDSSVDEPTSDPGDPSTPSVPTEVKGQTAQTPSSAPSTQHALNQPVQSQTTGHNPAAVPLSIDAGL